MYKIQEEKLVSDLRNGDQKAFECIFREFYQLLCLEARSYIADKQVIEELVGDVFSWLWLHRETLVITVSLRAYLIRATHNACLRFLRQNTPEIIELNDVYEFNTLYAMGESPLDYIISKELTKRINKAVEELPPQYKKVFIQSRYHEQTYQEIANTMNISINTVKLYLKKALARLRAELYK